MVVTGLQNVSKSAQHALGRQANLHEHVVPLAYVRTILLPHIVSMPVWLLVLHKSSEVRHAHVWLNPDGSGTNVVLDVGIVV